MNGEIPIPKTNSIPLHKNTTPTKLLRKHMSVRRPFWNIYLLPILVLFTVVCLVDLLHCAQQQKSTHAIETSLRKIDLNSVPPNHAKKNSATRSLTSKQSITDFDHETKRGQRERIEHEQMDRKKMIELTRNHTIHTLPKNDNKASLPMKNTVTNADQASAEQQNGGSGNVNKNDEKSGDNDSNKSNNDDDNDSSEYNNERAQSKDGGDEDAVHSSNNLLLITLTIVIAIMLTYLFLKYEFRYLPESIATIFVGGLLGALLVMNGKTTDDVFRLDTEYFFLVFLPPIIFESGYTLSKAAFFSNIGSILIFAVFGTMISSAVIGIGLGLLGVLPWIDALVFGAILSAIDPVATLAVFQTVEVESTLSTLVFGESVLNDAVSIVLYKTFYQFLQDGFSMYALLNAFTHFTMILFGSTAIGVLLGLFTSLMFKHMNFRKYHSLEMPLVFICCYVPYLIGEGLSLSGILCLLASAIVNSHYTHYNLAHESQITLQYASKALSFICETIVFAYLGLAVFTFTHKINLVLIIVTVLLCLIGRASNVYPLSWLCNMYRTNQISKNAQTVMWFSGLRGAIAFSLSMTLPGANQNAIVTTTLIICLLSMFILGGGTLPLLKHLYGDSGGRTTQSSNAPLSSKNLFDNFDAKYVRPFFCSPSDQQAGLVRAKHDAHRSVSDELREYVDIQQD